jgi:hypothetical protein
MANYTQHNLLTDEEAAALDALDQPRVCELVVVSWPAPDGEKVYAWSQWDEDPGYSGSVTEWLDGRPLIVAFTAQDPARRFHRVPLTSAIGDDVVPMRFSNAERAFETLYRTHGAGVRVEVFLHYPQLALTKSVWMGHLRSPSEVAPDFVSIQAANGFRSPQTQLPNYIHASNCLFYFGGELSAEEVATNPCDYDRHVGGSQGLLDGGEAFTSCDRTKADCLARHGDLSRWGGDETAQESVTFGGKRTGISTPDGNETRLKEPVGVLYGRWLIKNLQLLRSRKEYHPSPKKQDQGTLVTLFEVSMGRIKSISKVKVLDHELPRKDGLGLEIRLGGLAQSKTGFSPQVLSFNRRAIFRGDLNPINPAGYSGKNITAECEAEGRDEIRVYSDPETYTEEYTTNRAWCALDLLTNTWFGFRLDDARFVLEDWIYLAGKESTFNCYVTGGRTAQQVLQDIFTAAGWYAPYVWNGAWRVSPLEALDLEADDIPLLTDRGDDPNILWDDAAGTSRLWVSEKDDDEIPNVATIAFVDAAAEYTERVLTVESTRQQYKAGEVFGDKSKRRSDPLPVPAYGITDETQARALGAAVLNLGPQGRGGIRNNCEVKLELYRHSSVALGMHPNKVFELDSEKTDGYVEADGTEEGTPFRYFVVKELLPDDGDILTVIAQAYPAAYWAALTGGGLAQTAGATASVTWQQSCLTGFTAFGNSLSESGVASGDYLDNKDVCWGQTSDTLTGEEGFQWRMPNGGAQGRVGITTENCPDPESVSSGGRSYARFNVDLTPWFFRFAHNSSQVYVSHSTSSTAYADDAGPFTFDEQTRFGLDRDEDGKLRFLLDGEAVFTTGSAVTGSLRLAAVAGRLRTSPSVAGFDVADVVKTTPATSGAGTTTNATTTGGSTVTVAPLAQSAFLLVDRIWREADLAGTQAGFYFAAGALGAGAWGGAEMYRETGGTYKLLAEAEDASVLGEAVDVLAATETGSETVEVELYDPAAVLLSYTEDEIAAGAGLVYLGGEIFQYQTATQTDTSPNRWELSDLTNRGAQCTADAMATHVSAEPFCLLDDTLVWVPLPASELDQARNFRALTEGQLLAGGTQETHTLVGPNLTPTTPADYAVVADVARGEVLHTWSPVADACLLGAPITYEIYLDDSGDPGELLWSGQTTQWRETVTSAGSRTYHFRARNAYRAGEYVVASVTAAVATYGGGLVDYKDSVRYAADYPITLSGNQLVDGYTTAPGQRVLLTAQPDPVENGIWVTAAGAWARAADADSDDEVTAGMQVPVTNGSYFADSLWTLTTDDPIELGVTELVFEQTGQVHAGGDLGGKYPNPDVLKVQGVVPGDTGLALLETSIPGLARYVLELGTAAELNVPATPGAAAGSTQVVRGDDPRLTYTVVSARWEPMTAYNPDTDQYELVWNGDEDDIVVGFVTD